MTRSDIMDTNSVNLLNVSGRMLRAIRKRAGWNRPRFSDELTRHRKFDGDFTSVKSIERYERLPTVPPLQVERYREIIGPELFDELLRRYRAALKAHAEEEAKKEALKAGEDKKP
jgi:hypothetical protein